MSMKKGDEESMKGLEYISKEFKMDYKEIARNLGVTPSTLNDWVNKNKKIPDKRLDQLENLFSCPKNYFQKELNFEEMTEIRMQYIKSISEKQSELPSNESRKIEGYYIKESYEDEIEFLKSLLKEREKQNDIRKIVESLMSNESVFNFEELENYEINKNPLLTDSSDTETLSKVMRIMTNESLANKFKVIVYILSIDEELGGLPLTAISEDYKGLADGFIQLLEKNKK